MRDKVRQHDFPSPEALAAALAERVSDALRAAVKARGGAALAVSGGTTPGRFFEALSRQQLDWANVVVTLVDERFVPPTSDRSNERLVRRKLLANEAWLARFVPLHSDKGGVQSAAKTADAALGVLPRPLDVVVLGMGTDGHTASFFPDATTLGDLLDADQPRRVLPVETEAGGEARLTLTLPVIASARLLVLHIEGEAKRTVLERALTDEGRDMPIRAVIDAAPAMEIYWAP